METKSWLINVNATIYNIFGSVMEFGEKIPWRLNKNKKPNIGDIVYFYLTNSEVREPDKENGGKIAYSVVEPLFGRFLFKGVVENNNDEYKAYDEKYWTNKKCMEDEKDKAGNYDYAIIRIKECLYEYNINKNMIGKDLFSRCTLYELDEVLASKIEEEIAKHK